MPEIPEVHVGLGQAIFAVAEESQDPEIAQDLKLLPNLIADMAIGRMQLREVFGTSIDIRQIEFSLAKRSDNIEGHLKSNRVVGRLTSRWAKPSICSAHL